MNKYQGNSQKGYSISEFMVAMTITFFIAAALIALFVNAKQNYRMNESMSRLQENARFAMTFLARDMRIADYRTCVTNDRRGDAISGQDNIGTYASDIVTIIWQSNDCASATALETTVYSIQTGSTGQPSLFRSVNGTSQELVEGIEDLQIVYGEDTDNDTIPNHYVTVDNITDVAQVVSVNLTLIARTLESNISTSGGRITRNFSSTVTLRNRVP